jgi:uncharacterized membrane protein YkvA (DUF1232 family)
MPNNFMQDLRARAKALKNEIHALAIAFKDPRTPFYAKAWVLLVVAYALSPIDLIPDFIPILGSLDDLILLPLGIAVAIRLVPAEVLSDARLAANQSEGKMLGMAGALVIGLVWLLALGAAFWWVSRFFQK